ncbi:MAG: aldo/keto reductase, partial [Deltaproteobacteria bacterium]|nr:aldo/keto reductase [Deltaproteobacteria bacterium]
LYGPADEAEGIATIHAALDRGVTLLDTGDFYGMGRNELLIAKALRTWSGDRERALVSVKFGALRGPDGAWLGADARPAAVKSVLAYTLVRLGVDHVDLSSAWSTPRGATTPSASSSARSRPSTDPSSTP